MTSARGRIRASPRAPGLERVSQVLPRVLGRALSADEVRRLRAELATELPTDATLASVLTRGFETLDQSGDVCDSDESRDVGDGWRDVVE